MSDLDPRGCVEDDNRRTDERGWIRPKDMVGYELTIWEKHFGGGFRDYERHHHSATHFGNSISVARMEKFAHLAAIARLRGGQV